MPDTTLTKMEALDKAEADYRKIWYAQEPQRRALDVEHDKTWEILRKAWDDVRAEKELRKEVLESAAKLKKIATAYKKKLDAEKPTEKTMEEIMESIQERKKKKAEAEIMDRLDELISGAGS